MLSQVIYRNYISCKFVKTLQRSAMKQILLFTACLLFINSSFAQKQLWGMAGANGTVKGTIFKTDSAGDNYSDVYTFNDPTNGLEPYGSLVKAANGYLYGLTSRGGTKGFGVLFRLDPVTGAYTKKHDVDSVNGKTPYGSLVQAPNGKLYGMTYSGGSYTGNANIGVLFEFDPATDAFAVKVDFLLENAARAYGSLVVGSDARLYGLTSGGGADASGLLFNFDIPTNTFTRLESFISGPGWEGFDPRGQLVQAADGSFYGLSRYGQAGWSGGGVVFRYDPAAPLFNKMTALHKFIDTLPGSQNGNDLMGSLIQAVNGKLYGMTRLGGINDAGTIFEYDLVADTCTKLYDLNNTTDGFGPYGSLMQASDGNLYGLTTSQGGQARLFRYNIAVNTLTVKANVTGTPHYTALIEATTTTGLNNHPFNAALKIYPMPARNIIYLDIPVAHRYGTVVITDISGKVTKRQDGEINTINVADLPTGVYFLAATVDGNVLHGQVVKN
jgi:uncharacterized repeat protein (TIGR03803 family)